MPKNDIVRSGACFFELKDGVNKNGKPYTMCILYGDELHKNRICSFFVYGSAKDVLTSIIDLPFEK